MLLDRIFGWMGYSRSLENPSVSLNDPEAWEGVFGSSGKSGSGITVTHKKALSIPAVWQAVGKISGDVAKLPLDLYFRTGENSRERADSAPAQLLVRRRANEEVTAKKFWRRFMVHMLLWNRAYAFIDRNGRGEPMGLYNLLPDRTYSERVNGRLGFVTEVDGKLEGIPARDVLHVEGISINNLDGCDLIEQARNSLGLALAAEGFASKFFANGAQPGGILELPATMTKKARDNIETGWKKKYEGESNWFKTVILRDGAKFHEVTVDAERSQMHELREDQVREVARIFNLSPSRLGLSDSVSYNSKSEDAQDYLDSTLQIHLELIADECWAKLLTNAQQANHFFEHNTRSLLRMNTQSRFEVYRQGFEMGVLSPNEIRSKENMNPREGGDDYYLTANVLPVSGGVAVEMEGESAPAGERATLHDVQRVLFNLGQRARHKAKNPRAFCEWVDGGLAYHRKEFRQVFGECPDVESMMFDAVINEFNGLLDNTQPEDLPGVVDETIRKHEAKAEFFASELESDQ